MPDILGDITTTVTKRPGDRMTNGIEVHGDTDWIAGTCSRTKSCASTCWGIHLPIRFCGSTTRPNQMVLDLHAATLKYGAGGSNDHLTGNAAANILNMRNDVILGRQRRDKIIGAAGNDIMIGRRDADQLGGGGGRDTIVDFTAR